MIDLDKVRERVEALDRAAYQHIATPASHPHYRETELAFTRVVAASAGDVPSLLAAIEVLQARVSAVSASIEKPLEGGRDA